MSRSSKKRTTPVVGFGEVGTKPVARAVPSGMTSPNPTTGFVLFFDERDIEYLDIPPEKAFTLIISLGVKS